MSFKNFTKNDTLSSTVLGPTWIHVDNGATFGGGTLALTFIDNNGQSKALMDSTGTAITYTAGADDFYDFPAITNITLTLTGATNPVIYAHIRSEPRR
jgi:hypothetical protein